jgi:hypothetical protein
MSSVAQYRIENGRTYHSYKDGTYWFVFIEMIMNVLTEED